MSIQIKCSNLQDPQKFSILEVRINGKLSEYDYAILVSDIHDLNNKGKIRMLIELINFYGWAAGSLWHETQFAQAQFNNIERVALVGDKYWARGAYTFCRPFIGATIRYYDSTNTEDPKRWIWESE